jgi:sulfhydrogenase subunit beta (sulfur reductase)
VDVRTIDVAGLQSLIDALVGRGYTVLGPTERSGAIVNAPIRGIDDLPRGWGDDQEAAHYRLRRRDDEALFGFAAGAQSAKPVFFPADELMWRGRRTSDGQGFDVRSEPNDADGSSGQPPYALLGIRSCDLSAVGIHDTVLTTRGFGDAHYAARRADSFVIAVACSDPGGTCFCVSMGTGPKPRAGRGAPFDLSMTELLEGSHRFVVEVGTARGSEIMDQIGAGEPAPGDLDAAGEVTEQATQRMGRQLDTEGIKELLYASVDSPRWDDVASRCLACTNCTLVCPTCFCTTVEDVSDLAGREADRHRVWDSCFNADFSYIHGGVVRESTRSRYRQWMTHKLASWYDQFGSSGCVGCGRCITWCPAAIDITAEAAALRGLPGSNLPGSNLPGSNLPGSNLQGSNLPGSNQPDASARAASPSDD